MGRGGMRGESERWFQDIAAGLTQSEMREWRSNKEWKEFKKKIQCNPTKVLFDTKHT